MRLSHIIGWILSVFILDLVSSRSFAKTHDIDRINNTAHSDTLKDHSTKIYPFNDPKLSVDTRVNELLKQLTLEEKAGFLAGKSFWHFQGVGRLGVPSFQATDCGHGVTVILDKNDNYTGCATSFPTAVGQAATWDPQLIFKTGAALAREARATGSSILLGPMINLHRLPVGGRNYETYSEDPYLTGKLAAAFVRGVQSQHIGAVVKGFVANNQQKNQEHLNEIISVKTLNDLYFPAFKTVIAESDPVGVMMSYNSVNNSPTTQSSYLINNIIKNQWNYKGFVISDWRSVVSSLSMQAQLDIEMPGPGRFMDRQSIVKAINDGTMSLNELDEHVRRYLRAVVKSGQLDIPKTVLNSGLNTPEHHAIALATAESSIVLLKNAGNILPLNKKAAINIGIFGPNALTARLGGGGSASVTPCYTVSPLDGLKNHKGKAIRVSFEEGAGFSGNSHLITGQDLKAQFNGKLVPGLKAEFFDGYYLSGAPRGERVDEKIDFSWGWASPSDHVNKNSYSVRWSGTLTAPETGEYELAVNIVEGGFRLYLDGKLLLNEWGNPGNEVTEAKFISQRKAVKVTLEKGTIHELKVEFHKKGQRNSIRLEWEIPGQPSPIDAAVALAKKVNVAIVFAGLSNRFEGGANDKVNLNLPGDQDKLISAIAAVNPNVIVVLNNGTPVIMPWINKVKGVLEAFYPGVEGGNAIAKVLFGDVNPSGKLPDTYPVQLKDVRSMANYPGTNDITNYAEEDLIGYRQFDADRIKPLFPFGYGMSYTSFKFSNLKLIKKDHKFKLSILVQNTGKVAGAEVVEVYMQGRSKGSKSYKELKGFDKVMLKPGQTKIVQITLAPDAFSFFDSATEKWAPGKGKFEIMVGHSSTDISLRKMIDI
jgi:beta-glucosidase